MSTVRSDVAKVVARHVKAHRGLAPVLSVSQLCLETGRNGRGAVNEAVRDMQSRGIIEVKIVDGSGWMWAEGAKFDEIAEFGGDRRSAGKRQPNRAEVLLETILSQMEALQSQMAAILRNQSM